MKNQGHKGVREMPTRRSAQDKATIATLTVGCYDQGMWMVNGDPCQDDLTAARLVMQCLESLADARDRERRR
jgi:hypothetical protein